MKIGVLAEEDNDVQVIDEIISKLIAVNSFSIKNFVGHGCGKLRRKCCAWAEILSAKGCKLLIVVHDLDRNNERNLREGLNRSIARVKYNGKLILIPKEEIEAWLLSDAAAIKVTFSMQAEPRTPANPELTVSPKEYLKALVWTACKKRYIHTMHNKKIAHNINVNSLEKCPSFVPLREFVAEHF